MAVAKSVTSASNGKRAKSETIPVTNPITNQVIGHIEKTPRADIETGIRRARAAQRMWAAISPTERCKILTRFADLLWEHQQEAVDTNQMETGRSATSAFGEVISVVNTTYWLQHNAPHILAPERRATFFPLINYARVYHKPYGVVGCITPWNYPLLLVYIDVIPALAAGNAVIIKPSEIAPYSALLGQRLLHQAGVPKDVLQVVTGDGETGAALIDLVDFVNFTGSSGVGKKIAKQAAERMIPYCLELGGKGSMIVLKDADLDWTATQALLGSTESTGQMCISVERCYVEEAIYPQFIEKIKHYAQQFKIGAGNSLDIHVGSMTTEPGLARVEKQVADAIAKGAKLIYGGRRRPDLGPLFYEPAILIDVDHTMEIMSEETFGPVLPIMSVKNESEAIKLANSVDYGLSSSIYTRDLKRGESLGLQLETGDVGINRTVGVVASPALPWGGLKQSGIGRRGGPEGLLRFTTPQTVYVETTIGSPPSLELLNTPTLLAVKILLKLRRYLPFV